MQIARYLVSAALLTLFAPGATAQTASAPAPQDLPDPATIVIPSLATDGPDADGKYAYFHKQGVGFAAAFADLSECYSYANAPIPPVVLPARVAVVTAPPAELARSRVGPSPYGLLGMGIASLLLPGIDRRLHQANMRMCMGFKAYKRYPLGKQAYIALTEGEGRQSILMQARIASGPMPATGALRP